MDVVFVDLFSVKQAKYFDEQEIDTYRECFNFNVPTGIVEQPKALGVIMRSLGLCPTTTELSGYYSSNASSDGKINFASFLNILHEHKKKENATEQTLSAFGAHDSSHSGLIRSKDLIRILTQTGEKLDRQTVEQLIKQSGAANPQNRVDYKDFVRYLTSPVDLNGTGAARQRV